MFWTLRNSPLPKYFTWTTCLLYLGFWSHLWLHICLVETVHNDELWHFLSTFIDVTSVAWNQPQSKYLHHGNCKCYNQGLTYWSVDCLDLQKWREKCKPCQLDACVVSIVTELWIAQNVEKMVFQHTEVPDAALPLSIQRLSITQKQYIVALDEKTSSCFVFIFFQAGYIRKIRSDMDKIFKNMYFLHVWV